MRTTQSSWQIQQKAKTGRENGWYPYGAVLMDDFVSLEEAVKYINEKIQPEKDHVMEYRVIEITTIATLTVVNTVAYESRTPRDLKNE